MVRIQRSKQSCGFFLGSTADLEGYWESLHLSESHYKIFEILLKHHKRTVNKTFSFPKQSSLNNRFCLCSHLSDKLINFHIDKAISKNDAFFFLHCPSKLFLFSSSCSIQRNCQVTGFCLFSLLVTPVDYSLQP